MKDSEIVSRLRGFIDINGDEPPNEDQWYKIVKLVFDTDEEVVEKKPPTTAEDLMKAFEESKNMPRPYGPPMDPLKPFGSPWELPDAIGERFPWDPTDPYKIVFTDDSGAPTARVDGVSLDNSIWGGQDVTGLELTIPDESKPKISETDTVEFDFSVSTGDDPPDDRHNRSDG